MGMGFIDLCTQIHQSAKEVADLSIDTSTSRKASKLSDVILEIC